MTKNNSSLTIREVCLEDAALLMQWWNDPEIMGHVGLPAGLGLSLADVQKSIRKGKSGESQPPSSMLFMVLLGTEKRPIGELNYSGWDPVRSTVAVGIKICEIGSRRCGHGRAALGEFLKLLQSRLGVSTVTLDVLARNIPAWRLYEELGFRLVRRRRDAYHCAETDELLDVLDYCLDVDG